MDPDPRPEERCRCISDSTDPFTARCPLPATDPDGRCDHCRQLTCDWASHDYGAQCCRARIQLARLVEPSEPCALPDHFQLTFMAEHR